LQHCKARFAEFPSVHYPTNSKPAEVLNVSPLWKTFIQKSVGRRFGTYPIITPLKKLSLKFVVPHHSPKKNKFSLNSLGHWLQRLSTQL
jgi:hypothetical protein